MCDECRQADNEAWRYGLSVGGVNQCIIFMGHLEPISCGLITLDGARSGAVFKRSPRCGFNSVVSVRLICY